MTAAFASAALILAGEAEAKRRLLSLETSKALAALPSRVEAPGAGAGAAANAVRAIRAALEGVDPAILTALAERGLVLRIVRGGNLLADTVPIPDPRKRIGIPPSGVTHASYAQAGEIGVDVNEAGLLSPDELPPLAEGHQRGRALATLMHELAHAVDAASGRAQREFRCELYERRRAAGGPFPTRYGATQCGEYFAESAALYLGMKDFHFSMENPGGSSANGAGPAWLLKFDPDLHAELERTFGPARDLHALPLDPRGAVFPGEPILPAVSPRPHRVPALRAPPRAPRRIQPQAAPPETGY